MKTKKERVQIFIDGGNFFHLVLKKLEIDENDFLFDKFAKFLANGREITNLGKRYYVGTVREKEGDQRSKERMSKQTKLFTTLKKGGWEIKTSKLRIRNEKIIIDSRVNNYQEIRNKGIFEVEYTRMREKGIDVKLATDLIIGSFDDRYDTAIIVSSDTDLVPAMDVVKYKIKKQIECVGFSIPYKDKNNNEDNTKPQLTMIRHSDIQRGLVESDIKKFVQTQEKLLK